MPFSGLTPSKRIIFFKLRVGYMCIEESFDTFFNMSYCWGRIPHRRGWTLQKWTVKMKQKIASVLIMEHRFINISMSWRHTVSNFFNGDPSFHHERDSKGTIITVLKMNTLDVVPPPPQSKIPFPLADPIHAPTFFLNILYFLISFSPTVTAYVQFKIKVYTSNHFS